MDELEQLAQARPVQPPSPATVARYREALVRQASARQAGNRRALRFRWMPRVLVPAAAMVLAVAAGVATVAVVNGPASGPDSGSATPSGGVSWNSGDAREMLLVAAERAQHEPDPGARTYWVSTVEHGSLVQVGTGSNRYAIMTRRTETTWRPLVPGKNQVYVERWAGAAPASDRDRAAWQAAGAPTTWPMDPVPNGPSDPTRVYTAAPGDQETGFQRVPDERPFNVLSEPLTAEQVRALPAEPDALRTWLVGVITKQNLPRKTDVELGESLFDGVVNLVFDTPVTPAVRAAAFRVLAGVTGVRSLGAVKDAKGRPGVAVSVQRNDTAEEQAADSGGPMEVSLVFDPTTGDILASQDRALKPADYMSWVPAGAVVGYRLIQSVRITDDDPPRMPLERPTQREVRVR